MPEPNATSRQRPLKVAIAPGNPVGSRCGGCPLGRGERRIASCSSNGPNTWTGGEVLHGFQEPCQVRRSDTAARSRGVFIDDSSNAHSKTLNDEHVVQRAAVVVGLGGVALVHLLDVENRLAEARYVGWLFIGLIVVSPVLAAALIRTDDTRAYRYWPEVNRRLPLSSVLGVLASAQAPDQRDSDR